MEHHGNQEVLEVKPFMGDVYADYLETLFKDHVIYTTAAVPFVFFS